jgi:hypothetical protein
VVKRAAGEGVRNLILALALSVVLEYMLLAALYEHDPAVRHDVRAALAVVGRSLGSPSREHATCSR